MEFETIGRRLKRLRVAAGMTQVEVALCAGVAQGVYSRWERDQLAVPQEAKAPLAQVLGVNEHELTVLLVPQRPPGRPTLPALLTVDDGRKLEPLRVEGTLDDVRGISENASNVVAAVCRQVPRGTLAAFLQNCPRDSKWELYILLHLMAMGAWPDRIALVTQRCPLLAVEGYRSLRLAVRQPRIVLVLEMSGLLLVITPQVWVVSPVQSEWYRLDFLCGVYDAQGNVRFADLEFDTMRHDDDLDRRRARGICAPRIGVRPAQVDRHDFGGWLIERLEGLLHDPEPTFISIKTGITPR